MNITIRPVSISDMENIAQLADDIDIARMTACLPSPYTLQNAQEWLEGLSGRPNEHVFAVCGESFMGVVGLTCEPDHDRAELGYWIGRPYWGKGIATAAVRLAIDYAFCELNFRRVYAYCFAANAASRCVLEKCSLQYEGCLRQHFVRMGAAHDLLCFGLLREEYLGKDANHNHADV